jgi:hypothetical protein
VLCQYFVAWVSILAITFSSCSPGDDTASFRNENIDGYNEEIQEGYAAGGEWCNDPLLIVHKLLLSKSNQEGNPYFKIEGKADAVNHMTLTVTQEGVMDDSVNGEKRIISFIFQNGKWRISQIKVGFKCFRNRGHDNYSGQACS